MVGEDEILTKKYWHVVQVYSGYEHQVVRALQQRIASSDMDVKFGEILVPVEEVVEINQGKQKRTTRKFYPGYVLVEMEKDEAAWYLVREIPKVSGFVGGHSDRPSVITEQEVESIRARMQEGVAKPKPKVLFEVGEVVRVTEGPFTDFTGSVKDINYEKNSLQVGVSIFGRETPVWLEFGQVAKA